MILSVRALHAANLGLDIRIVVELRTKTDLTIFDKLDRLHLKLHLRINCKTDCVILFSLSIYCKF